MPLSVAGCEIDVEERGEGRPIVFVHGLAGDRRLLREVCEPVGARAVGCRRVYLDLPGHGRSGKNLPSASADELCEVLARVIAGLGGGEPLVVAHAYGAYLAQALPSRIACAGLLLASPVVEPDLGARSLPPRRVARRVEPLRFADEHERETFEEAAVVQAPAILARYHELVYPASLACDRGFLEALRARYALSRPFREALRHFEGPVAIVCGRDDHWVGYEDALRLVRLFPRVSLSVLESCGPLLLLEETAAFQRLLADWLARAGVEVAPA